jgi:hypothetical protein
VKSRNPGGGRPAKTPLMQQSDPKRGSPPMPLSKSNNVPYMSMRGRGSGGGCGGLTRKQVHVTWEPNDLLLPPNRENDLLPPQRRPQFHTLIRSPRSLIEMRIKDRRMVGASKVCLSVWKSPQQPLPPNHRTRLMS